MSNFALATFKPKANGPLAPRAQRRQLVLAKMELMVEDRDAVTDLSHEPDLSDFPHFAWQFLGANLALEDMALEEEADDDTDFVGEEDGNMVQANRVCVSEEDEFADDIPYMTTEEWAKGRYSNFYPHLWANEPEVYPNGPTCQSDSSGFGANQKYKVSYWDFDWYPARRGHHDYRKNRKSAVHRFRRSERKLRTVDTARQHEAEANLAFDHLPAQQQAYERGEYLRSPANPSAEGWWFMDLPYRERSLFEEREQEEAREQERQDERLAHLHFLYVVYGHPDNYQGMPLYPDYGDYDTSSYPDDDSDSPKKEVDLKTDDDDFAIHIPTVEEIEDMIAQ